MDAKEQSRLENSLAMAVFDRIWSMAIGALLMYVTLGLIYGRK